MPGTAACLPVAQAAVLGHQQSQAPGSHGMKSAETQQPAALHSTSPAKLHGSGVAQATAAATATHAWPPSSSDRDGSQQLTHAQPAFDVYISTAPAGILGATSASVLGATSNPTSTSHPAPTPHVASSSSAPALPPTPHAFDGTHKPSASTALPMHGSSQFQRGAFSSRVQDPTKQQHAELHRDRAHTVDLACIPAGSETSDSSDPDCEEATRRLTAAFPNLSSVQRRGSDPWTQPPSQQRKLGPDPEPASPSRILSSASSTCSDVAEALERRRQGRNNYHLTGQAAVELFMRLNHARQTLDFAKRQASLFSAMDRAQMDVWQALDKLSELREYEAALMSGSAEVHPDMALKEHAMQTAELCRLAHPDKDWLHLVGLMHGLGKLLAHQMFGAQPQWATCGESFPLGCRFDPALQGTQFFSVNPDRRRRLYNTPLGIYRPRCGLENVYMSWSAAEYLYLMLLLNETQLPPEALFIIRHQKFTSLTKPGGSAYQQLLSNADKALLPLLASFQQLSAYRRVALPASQLDEGAQRAYYQELIGKYIGHRKLSW